MIHLGADEITLKDELTLINQYVELERLHGKSFNFDMNIDKSIKTEQIFTPPFLIQPLVENTIKHGAKRNLYETGQVSIDVRKTNFNLLIKILDNGILICLIVVLFGIEAMNQTIPKLKIVRQNNGTIIKRELISEHDGGVNVVCFL